MRQFVAFALALGTVAHSLAAQEPRAEAERAIEKYERYLSGKPYHDWALDKLVEAAVSRNELKELVERYEERVAENAEDVAARVVLARLYARTDQHEDALATLAAVELKDAELHRLVGSFEFERSRWDDAVTALDLAAAATSDEKLLEEIHGLRGRALLATGDRDRACEAFQALAGLRPDDFHLRLEAASTLAFHGLTEEALEQFDVARDLAGADTAKRCRVMSEIGRLHERLNQGPEALSVYHDAIGLMARGNWLKRDLYDRVLALHRRSGTLDELVERSRADAEGNTLDLDVREFHARALEEAGQREDARDVLVAATKEFAGDLGLSRRLIGVLQALDDADAVVAEYQRILAERPEELELYIELGQAFAAEGRFEQAKLQWQRTLEQRLTDAALCIRLAGLHAFYGSTDEAVRMYEKAIELEPRDLRHYADLAAFVAVRDGRESVGPLLERAAAASAGDPARLEELAGLWKEHGDVARARAAIEAALAIRADEPRLLQRLADLLIEEGETETAADTLQRVVELAEDSALRRTAIDRLLRLFRRMGRLEELIEIEEARVAAGSRDVAPYLVLSKAYAQRRQPELALARVQMLLEFDPENEDALLSAARLHEQAGEFDLALERYQKLIELTPQSRRQHLKAIAQIHLSNYDQDEAFACYDEILAATPDNPAAFKEVSKSYLKLRLYDRAAECLEQAVRLAPDDGRMRLELASIYRTMGEWGRAEAEILAAVGSNDVDVSNDARERWYELVSESGRVGDEIERLRRRIQENPYDLDSPLALTDVYVRELEYELALEMLERLLTYQPTAARLLEQRARILVLMERYTDAIADFETLWKLPDANRERLALSIAEAALERGDRERAEQVLANVSDLRAVASLYRQHDLHAEAVDAIERGIARAPSDTRLLGTLARLHEGAGDREAAAEVLERLLSLRPDSWRLVVRLGGLYHELDREEEVTELGHRLFELIRVEDEDEEDSFAGAGAGGSFSRVDQLRMTSGSMSGGSSSQLSNRVYDIQTYFRDKGKEEEFRDIGAEEILLQPTNITLFRTVLGSLARAEEQGARVQGLVDAVRGATLDRDRFPPGLTRNGWARELESMRMRSYSNDPSFAGTRVDDLSTALADGSATELEIVELAAILNQLKRRDEMLETLRVGVERFPESAQVLTGLAKSHEIEKRYAEAEGWYRRLVAVLEEGPVDPELAESLELSFRTARPNILAGFPMHMQRAIGDAELRRFWELTQSRRTALGWGLGLQQYPAGAKYGLASCLAKLDRDDEARAVLASLEPDDEDRVAEWILLAYHFYQLEMFDEAEAIHVRLLAKEAELSEDPLFGFNRSWSGRFTSPMRNYARILEKKGEILEAYDLLRTYGDTTAGELLLQTNEDLGAAEGHYRERLAAEEARLSPNGANTDPWRDAAVRLVEVLQYARRWDDALAVYGEIEARRPDDFEVLRNVALLHERAGRWEEAIAVHFRIIERKVEGNRRRERQTKPTGRALAPVAPEMPTADEHYSWRNLSRSRSYMTGTVGRRYSNRENYVAVLKLYLDQREVAKATEVMRSLAREDASTFSWIGSSLAGVIENYKLGADAVPILRLIHTHNPGYERLTLQYGTALVAAKKYEEARRVLTDLAGRRGLDSYYRDRARRQLDAIASRLGAETKETLEDLRAAVEADPKNVKSRMNLARRLFGDHDYEGALEHGLAAEELAPHLDETELFVNDCLQVSGRQAELEERLVEGLDDIDDNGERIAAAVQIANWMWERGDREAVDALFERATERATASYPYITEVPWYVEKGLVAEARARLLEDIEKADTWRRQEMQSMLSKIDAILGDPTSTLDGAWKQYEKSTALGDRAQVLMLLATPLRDMPGIADQAEVVRAAAAEHGGLRGELYFAALDLALGDLEPCERRLAALARADRDNRFLYPAVVSLARAREDHATALAYLAELEALDTASESDRVSTSIGYLTEKDALLGEIGSLRFRLGDVDGAWSAWDAMLDEDVDAELQMRAKLCAEHDLFDEAIDAQRRYLEKVGERQYRDLDYLGDLETRRGNHDAAIEAWTKALILVGDSESQADDIRTKLLTGYRRAGRVDDFLDDMRGRAESDPDDVNLRKRIIRLTAEKGSVEEALAELEELLDRPGQAEHILPALIERATLAGNTDRAIEWYERLLAGNVQEWDRRNHTTQFTKLLIERGEIDRAIEAVRDAHEDPDGVEALQQIAGILIEEDLWAEAEPFLERGLEIDDGNYSFERWHRQLLTNQERWDELVDLTLERLRDRDSLGGLVAEVSTVRDLLDETDIAARIEAELAESPEDPDCVYRAAVLALARDDDPGAIELLEKVLESDPDDRFALELLHPVYEREERYADARRVLERRIEFLDREQGVVGSTSSWQIDDMRRSRAMLCLREDDLEGAKRSMGDRLGLRYVEIDSYRYQYGNSFYSSGFDLASLYFQLELYDEFLDEWRRARAFQSRGESDARGYEARFRLGERETVLDELWRRVYDPTADLFQSDNYENYWSDLEGMLSSGGAEAVLVRLHMETDTLDELVDKVARASAHKPRRKQLSDLHGWLLLLAERRAELAVFLEKRLAEKPFDADLLLQVGRNLRHMGRYEEALPHLELAHTLHRGIAFNAATGWDASRWVFPNRGQQDAIRFAFASGNQNMSIRSSGATHWGGGSSRGGPEADVRRELIGLYRKLGRVAEAEELDKRERRGAEAGHWYRYSNPPLPALFEELGLVADADRELQWALEQELEEADTDQAAGQVRIRFLERLAGLHHRAGDESRRDEYLTRWQAAIDEPNDEEPTLWTHLHRALFRVRMGGDRAGAERDIERAHELMEEHGVTLLPDLAWIRYELGDYDEALADFRAIEAESRLSWGGVGADVRFGIGACLAARGEIEEARPVLLRALAARRNHERADEARALLDR